MVPLGSVINVSQTFGPDVVQRYNAYRAADINGGPAPGYSSGQAQAAMTRVLQETLPRGMSFEWTELALPAADLRQHATLVFPLCVLFVFLVLAAQYESLTCAGDHSHRADVSARRDHGRAARSCDNNIFMQIGLLVLVGLACKNAILIVEFAKHLQDTADTTRSRRCRGGAAAPAADSHDLHRLHHGVVRWCWRKARAEVRHAMGITVFAGMIA